MPLLSVVYTSDPPLLPVVYDNPECGDLMNGSILSCPRPPPGPFILPDPDFVGGGLRRKRWNSEFVPKFSSQKSDKLHRPRRQPIFPDNIDEMDLSGVLGRLTQNTVGSGALVSIVGVRCDGESVSMIATVIPYGGSSLYLMAVCSSVAPQARRQADR